MTNTAAKPGRIYRIAHKSTRVLIRYVRARTLNGAVRALADEMFEATPATAEDIVQAVGRGELAILDALDEGEVAAPALRAVS